VKQEALRAVGLLKWKMLLSCLLCFGLDDVYGDMLVLTSSFNLKLVPKLGIVRL
jgi:hypothetical protein